MYVYIYIYSVYPRPVARPKREACGKDTKVAGRLALPTIGGHASIRNLAMYNVYVYVHIFIYIQAVVGIPATSAPVKVTETVATTWWLGPVLEPAGVLALGWLARTSWCFL